jgi:hypothetical protein
VTVGGSRRWWARRFGAVVGVLGALGGMAACSAEEVGKQSAVDAYCSGLCEVAQRCHLADGSCSTSCADQSDANRYSPDGAKQLGECVAVLDCATVADDAAWNEAFDACWQSSKPLVETTARARSVCAGYVEASFECGSFFSTQECENNFRMWSDQVLDQVAACLGTPECDGLHACVQGVFESP